VPPNPARNDAKTMKLAAMDFALCPIDIIKRDLQLGSAAISLRRTTVLYKETLEEIEKQFREKMAQTPGTAELRKTISWAMSIAIKKILGILSSPKTSNRDLIAAARLTAQIDGRFLGSEVPESRSDHDTESVAQELLQAMRRVNGSVQ
jgi:hypothetical protein